MWQFVGFTQQLREPEQCYVKLSQADNATIVSIALPWEDEDNNP